MFNKKRKSRTSKKKINDYLCISQLVDSNSSNSSIYYQLLGILYIDKIRYTCCEDDIDRNVVIDKIYNKNYEKVAEVMDEKDDYLSYILRTIPLEGT